MKKQQLKENTGIWKPADNELYYYIQSTGKVRYVNYDITKPKTRLRVQQGTHYKTKQEAKHQAKVQRYTNLFKRYVEEHSEKLDWNNTDQVKCYMGYNYELKGICFYTETTIKKYQGVIYASSDKILNEAVDFVGKDNVIKYVLGVD